MESANTSPNNFPPNIQAALERASKEIPREHPHNHDPTQYRGYPAQRGDRFGTFGRGRAAYQQPSPLHPPPGLGHSLPYQQIPPQPPTFSPETIDFPPLSPQSAERYGFQRPVVKLPPPPMTPPANPFAQPLSQQRLTRPAANPPHPINLGYSTASPASGHFSQFQGDLSPQLPSPQSQSGVAQPQRTDLSGQRGVSDSLDTFGRDLGRGGHRGMRGQGNRGRPILQQGLHPNSGGRGSRGSRHSPLSPFQHSPTSPMHRGSTYPTPQHVLLQSRYLTEICSRELQNSISPKELKNNESFRKRLERILQDMIREWAKENVTVNPTHVKLKSYGSMANGFAVPGSDMDLLVMFPKDEDPIGPIEAKCPRMFEERLLAEGYGARLLTKTRVPILRVCQSPGQDLLDDLRAYRIKSIEQEREEETEKQMKKLGLKASRLPDNPDGKSVDHSADLELAVIIPLPPSPTRESASIEFDKTVGIQCDINFTNSVAIFNTNLLRCYCTCDDRVRQLGLVVKAWVKARKINTPYHGTLSSYGYILMVLHFLMNVADPPVIPNLQSWAKADDNRKDGPKSNVQLFEGFDVRFMSDEAILKRMAAAGELTRNHEPLGSLLRGFYGYYADPRGFHFSQEVISIRTDGGILRKTSKGWTEAKRTGNDGSIRLRYLLCIEDPFEVEHNVARTVGHSGIVAIRDEFRRAWDIINKVDFVPGSGWQWRKPDGTIGEDLFAQADDRGDLLRKDADYHKEKMAKLREEKAAAQKLESQPQEASVIASNSNEPNGKGELAHVSHHTDHNIHKNV